MIGGQWHFRSAVQDTKNTFRHIIIQLVLNCTKFTIVCEQTLARVQKRENKLIIQGFNGAEYKTLQVKQLSRIHTQYASDPISA